ncbi:MAG: Dabb family protein [Candidatus Omnitrophota bacterium]|jgi:hypothetical protein
MIVHSVYFWLERGLSPAELELFLKGIESLRGIPGLERILTGSPAKTSRPAVDRTYDYALTILMKDKTAYRSYQEHPLHCAFIEQCSRCWMKLVIYDHEEAAS